MTVERFFGAVRDALARAEDLTLCTIISSSGSTPRGSGAKMAVRKDGSTVGTVGGGLIEFGCARLAREALARRASFIHEFNLTSDEVADAGMICGGHVSVLFQFFSGADPAAVSLFQRIADLSSARRDSWLLTEIEGGVARRMGVYARGAGLFGADGIPEARILPLLRARCALEPGDPAFFAESLARAGRVFVFGGGHVSQELVPLLARVDFRVAVYEDREEFADPALFPAADETIIGSFSDVAARVSIGPEDDVVILTRGHQADCEVLRQALLTDANYIGMIGSRQKIATTFRRLMESGVSEEALLRVHSPIGLAILAETPAEIAVSIAAEMILHRAKRAGEAGIPAV